VSRHQCSAAAVSIIYRLLSFGNARTQKAGFVRVAAPQFTRAKSAGRATEPIPLLFP
jgi:hypothetical protein